MIAIIAAIVFLIEHQNKMPYHAKYAINYIEFKTHDLEQTKAFYSTLFGWKFTDYGPTYTAFTKSGIEGGFELSKDPVSNGALVVLYHEHLEEILKKKKLQEQKLLWIFSLFPVDDDSNF